MRITNSFQHIISNLQTVLVFETEKNNYIMIKFS